MEIFSEKLTMCNIEKEVLIEDASKIQWDTNFNFLKQHNGLRNGKIHLVLGTTGAGKSTLTRTLVCDSLSNLKGSKMAGIWLSEETTQEFKMEFSRTQYEDRTDNFHVASELNPAIRERVKTPKGFLNVICQYIEKLNLKLLFIDNITTSYAYVNGRGIENQNEIANGLKDIASKYSIPIVVIAHTNAEISDNFNGIISSNHIRGSKLITLIAEFLYILQRVIINEKIIPLIRVEKHRGQEVKSNLHELGYIASRRIFGCDMPVNFNEFRDMFRDRNKL